MRQYRQLTEDDRIEIYAMKQAGKTSAPIALRLGVDRSTIYRELQRNSGHRGYRPKQAHQNAIQRRYLARKAIKMTPETIDYIEQKIKTEHAPEQVARRMKIDPHWTGPTVSHERIYQHIWRDKREAGQLYKHLRIAGTKQRRKRRNSKDSRGTIPHRVGIEKRPHIVDQKKRIGDWEGDTMIGAHHKGALVTLVERKSKFTLIGKVRRPTAEAVKQKIVRLLRRHRKRVHTLTVDNGKEFTEHQAVAKSLKAKVYFADPYAAWQRGLNENTNGLIRQYFPKGMDLRYVTHEKLNLVMTRLNQRPRKTLGFLTPNEVYYGNKRIK